MLSGYTIQESITERAKTIIERGIRNHDGQSVIIKRLKADNPNIKDISRLQHEYEISKDLDCSGIVKSYSLEADGNSFALILEDFGGQSLSQFLAATQLQLEAFFNIALSLTKTLIQLHQVPVIHKDIKPSNIIIHPETQLVKLTDFSVATRLPFQSPSIPAPNAIAGTLAYMSPEQTGRMNRYLDHRSDLYSLGVTFYQMLAGQLPFLSNDPLALMYAHLAEKPVPLHQEHNVPPALSEIILKLLAKRAEDRYQSAQGLQYDLQHCWSQLQTQGTIETFSLGQCDRASQLLIPQKLYGRETEVQTLLNAFDSIHNNNSRLILISGYPGIGKTSLVKELYYPLLRSRGYLISGKFDQLKRDTPYAAIAEAFQSLIRQLLTATQRELTHWQQQLQTALGDNAQIIIDLIPEAEFLIGKQPAVTPLIGKAAQTRFYRVFQQFVGVFCQPQHPLVLFLDDLQWADLASLQLIENLLSEETIQSFLLIGAYRNNEVDITHPLLNLRQKIHNSEIPIDEIQIQSLHFDDVDNIIKDTLKQETDQLSELKKLSNIIYQKTQGNPFLLANF